MHLVIPLGWGFSTEPQLWSGVTLAHTKASLWVAPRHPFAVQPHWYLIAAGEGQGPAGLWSVLCLGVGGRTPAQPDTLPRCCRWRTGPSTSWRPSTRCRSTPGWQISRTASTPGKARPRKGLCGG